MFYFSVSKLLFKCLFQVQTLFIVIKICIKNNLWIAVDPHESYFSPACRLCFLLLPVMCTTVMRLATSPPAPCVRWMTWLRWSSGHDSLCSVAGRPNTPLDTMFPATSTYSMKVQLHLKFRHSFNGWLAILNAYESLHWQSNADKWFWRNWEHCLQKPLHYMNLNRVLLGWTHSDISYFYNFCFSGDKYALKMRFVDHVFDDLVIDQMTFKVILPEGAR